jgi:hypothetical protein
LTLRQIDRFTSLAAQLQAREALTAIAIESWPHLRAPARDGLVRDWRRAARLDPFAGHKRVPAAEVEDWIRRFGRVGG